MQVRCQIIPIIDEDKEIENYTLTKRYHTRGNSRKDSITVDPQEEQKIGDQEYLLNLKKYLREAMNENEKVNNSDINSFQYGKKYRVIPNCWKIINKFSLLQYL